MRRAVVALLSAALLAGCGGGSHSNPGPFDTTPVPVGDTASALDPSWKLGPMMQVFVRAYQDSDGDGEGDLRGLIDRLDYLKALGVRGVLLLPISRNSDRDHGYMTTDFRDVDPTYGTLRDLDALIAAAHERGMGVLLDEVFVYTSTEHAGFVSASQDPNSPWRDWYVWSETEPAGYDDACGGHGWFSAPTGWYYGFFCHDAPQLNWKNPAVREYQQNTLRFWLNRGVDGFRLDAAAMYLENGPGKQENQPENVEALAELGKVVNAYDNRMLIAEAPGVAPDYAIRAVCGNAFAFQVQNVGWADPEGSGSFRGQALVGAAALADTHTDIAASFGHAVVDLPLQGPMGEMSSFLANHDRFAGKRLWDQFGGDGPAYRLASATLLLMPGTPFLYYGEEVGMAETVLPTLQPDRDHHQRGVMSWTSDPINAGFSTATALDGPKAITDPDDKYLKPVPNSAEFNVAAETGVSGSLLEHYRSLVALRAAHPALSRGGYRWLVDAGTTFVFERFNADERILVVVNLDPNRSGGPLTVEPGTWEPLYAWGATPGTLDGSTGEVSVGAPPHSLQAWRLASDVSPLGDVHVLGTMNGWVPDDSNLLVYQGGGIYTATLALPEGESTFKVADALWQLVVLGSARRVEDVLGQAVVDQPFVMEPTYWHYLDAGDDVAFDAPAAGDYLFTLDTANVQLPVLTITPAT